MRQTLLIVDDADFMRYILRDLFAQVGLSTVAEAGSRAEALDLARSLNPELIVVDTTAGAAGLALIRELAGKSPSSRIIAAVKAGDFDAAIAADRAGAEYTLVKPYDPVDVSVLMRTLQAQQPQLV